MRVPAAVMILVAACGTKPDARLASPPPPPPGVDAALPPLPSGCPATYGEVRDGAACTESGAGPTCTYPEGSCACYRQAPCSGAALGPEQYAAIPVAWHCTPVPPAVRPDGCPGSAPSGPCAREGQSCGYGDCCFHEYTCQSGAWNLTGGGCPP